jgi:hypothetical protein
VGGQASALRRRQIERVVVLHDLNSITDAVNHWRRHKAASVHAAT